MVMPSSADDPADPLALEVMLSRDGELVLDRLDAWASTGGSRTFVHYGDEDRDLSFAESLDLSARLAGGFAALGVERGDRVAAFLTNPLVTVLTMLAVWRLDAVYCPINYNLTGRLLAHPLRELEARLLVTEEGRVAMLDAVAGELAGLPPCVVHRPRRDQHDHDRSAAGARPRAAPVVVDFDDLLASSPAPRSPQQRAGTAAILQTSGTTGPSKGVVLSHRWINQYTFVPRHLVDRDDVIHNDLPLYHGAGAITNVVRAAWVGCEVALWDRFSASEFWPRIAKRGATNAILIDVMIARLMGAEERSSDRANTLHTVNMTPLPADHHAIASRFGIDLCGTAYGQTETGHGAFALVDEFPGGWVQPPELWRGKSKAAILDFATTHGFPVCGGECPCDAGSWASRRRSSKRRSSAPTISHYRPSATASSRFAGGFPACSSTLLLPPARGDRRGDARRVASHRRRRGARRRRPLLLRRSHGRLHPQQGREHLVVRGRGAGQRSSSGGDERRGRGSGARRARRGRRGVRGAARRHGADARPARGVLRRDHAALPAAQHLRIVEDLPRTATNKVEKYRLRDALLQESRSIETPPAKGRVGQVAA